MKKIFLLLAFSLMTLMSEAQAPAGFGRGQAAPAKPEVKTVKQTLVVL